MTREKKEILTKIAKLEEADQAEKDYDAIDALYDELARARGYKSEIDEVVDYQNRGILEYKHDVVAIYV